MTLYCYIKHSVHKLYQIENIRKRFMKRNKNVSRNVEYLVVVVKIPPI